MPVWIATIGLLVVYAGALGGTISTFRALLAGFLCLIATAAPVVDARGWYVSITLTVGAIGFWFIQTPSNDRNWSEIAMRAPYATINGTKVTIHDVRNFRHHEDGTWLAAWYDETYDTAEIEQGYLVLTRFGGIDGLAHVMASFRFKGDKYVVLSVEIRREEGESYDPIGGALREYELYYVAADERDAIALRTNAQKDSTWLIPMNAGPKKTAEFFMSMVHRMTKIHDEPEWYNSFTSSCASNLADHYSAINNVTFPPDYRILLPGFSEELIAELDLLPEGMSVEQARHELQINEAALAGPVDETFSQRIRR